MPTLHFACDHAGVTLKKTLLSWLDVDTYTFKDHGTDSEGSCDYPLFAHRLCQALQPEDLGILICGTGLGMSMAANRYAHIRAAVCTTELHASLARRHNNANVLCLGARMLGEELAKAIVIRFLNTDFEAGRHERRIRLLSPNETEHEHNPSL